MEKRLLVLLIAAVVAGAVVFTQPPLAQDAAYHGFADARGWLGIPNFQNVASNLPFLLVGLLGLLAVRRRPEAGERGAWVGLFAGVALTAFGSAYYHWRPGNDTLLWDRLPMALGFTALFAGVIGERVSRRAYRLLLWPLIGVGVASVLYWYASEQRGAGDLRLYILVQFFPLLTIPLIMAMYEPRYSHGRLVLVALGLYGAAKAAEVFDAEIYGALGGAASGHALKHLTAAGACFVLYRMFVRRSEITTRPDARPS